MKQAESKTIAFLKEIGARTPRVRYAEQNSAERSLHCKEVSIQLGRRGVQRATDVRESRQTNE